MSDKPKRAQMPIRLNPEERRQIETIAAVQEVSLSKAVRRMIEEAYAQLPEEQKVKRPA